MYDYISGKIAKITPTNTVIDVCGIGYDINISLITYQDIERNEQTKLFVYEAIREDAHLLYGFSTEEEREMFTLLISVSGVGAGTARTILSQLTLNEIKNAIATSDVNLIKRVKGIGLKTAQRIIVDLKEKVQAAQAEQNISDLVAQSQLSQEAVAALVALGYQRGAVVKIVDKIVKENPDFVVAKVIKKALTMV